MKNMKLTITLLLIASVVCSSWAYPAGGHPDDDVEVISDGDQPNYQPGYQPGFQPSPVPSVPSYPHLPTIPIPTVPLYPSYPVPAYPTYPSYFPFGWTYNIFDGFNNFFNQARDQVSSTWSRMPSIKPIIKNYWPDVKTNGNTTSTVKVVGDHKFIINETVHVQQSDFGHVVFKVRTVDIKPLEPSDQTTEGPDDESTISPEVDIDEPNTTHRAVDNDDDDDRPTVEDIGDIDDNRAGSPELLDDTNEIGAGNIENFEHDANDSENEIKKESLSFQKSEKIELESSPELNDSEEAVTLSPLFVNKDGTNDEWAEVELDNTNDQDKTFYEVNNSEINSEEVEDVTHDLSDDIAINDMLADQGIFNPDAEVFDVNQYQPEGDFSKYSSQEVVETQPESFDYLPYHHQTSDKRPNIK